jgi:hypothetical protein
MEFSWSVAFKNLSIAGTALAIGAAIAYFGDSILAYIGGGIVALIGVVMLFAVRSGGVAACPICSSEIVALSNSEDYKLCPGCREYLTIGNGVVRQMDPSSIAAAPKFAVPTPWQDLKAVTYQPMGTIVTSGEERQLHATWSNACCVCGEPATRLEDRAFQIYKWNGDLVRVNQTKIILHVNGVPHCDVHSKGMGLEQINFQSKGDDTDVKQDLVFTFRSYAYRNQVLELNKWPWR